MSMGNIVHPEIFHPEISEHSHVRIGFEALLGIFLEWPGSHMAAYSLDRGQGI